MIDLGYETHNSLFNLGTMAMFSMLYLIRVLILVLLWMGSNMNPNLEKTVNNLKDKLVFGEIIKIGLEAYFEFLIAGYLATYADIMTTDGEVMSTYLGWTVLVIALGLMPVTLMWLLFKPLEDLNYSDITKDFAPFFQELSKNSKGKMSYFFVFMIRRVYFVAISIYLKQYSLQIIRRSCWNC